MIYDFLHFIIIYNGLKIKFFQYKFIINLKYSKETEQMEQGRKTFSEFIREKQKRPPCGSLFRQEQSCFQRLPLS